MTVELLQTLSLTAYIAAGLFFLIGVALFFLLDVPRLYGDISGRTARKAIENIRLQNETTGNKAYKPSKVNAERGKLTDKITESGRLVSQETASHISVGTEKFATELLAPVSNETSILEEGINETTLLEEVNVSPDSGQTDVLIMEGGEGAAPPVISDEDFEVAVEMSFAESSEIIE